MEPFGTEHPWNPLDPNVQSTTLRSVRNPIQLSGESVKSPTIQVKCVWDCAQKEQYPKAVFTPDLEPTWYQDQEFKHFFKFQHGPTQPYIHSGKIMMWWSS